MYHYPIFFNTIHLGQLRISWFLRRYHGIKVSPGGVYSVLKRNGLNHLPQNAKKRTVQTKRYVNRVQGHHIQVDVKFLKFKRPDGQNLRRLQCTAIDDATRIRTPRIYKQHTQQNAIDFIDHVISKFPFRIHTVRTEFHWHLEDLGIRHVYKTSHTEA